MSRKKTLEHETLLCFNEIRTEQIALRKSIVSHNNHSLEKKPAHLPHTFPSRTHGFCPPTGSMLFVNKCQGPTIRIVLELQKLTKYSPGMHRPLSNYSFAKILDLGSFRC